jgi:hypothetical protein
VIHRIRGLAPALLAMLALPAAGQTVGETGGTAAESAKGGSAAGAPTGGSAAGPSAPAPAAAARKPAAPPASERSAVVAVLDKRLGTTAEFTLKPGERFSFGRLSGVLRTCERTQPFERKQSAAFVQLVEQPIAGAGQARPKPVLVFSGWIFAESPSLNPVVHPVYDVWLKSCTMRFPDGPRPPSSSTGRKKPSGGPKPAPAGPAPEPAPAEPAPAAPAAAAATPTA